MYMQHLDLSSCQTFVQKNVLPLIAVELYGQLKVNFFIISLSHLISVGLSKLLRLIYYLLKHLT